MQIPAQWSLLQGVVCVWILRAGLERDRSSIRALPQLGPKIRRTLKFDFSADEHLWASSPSYESPTVLAPRPSKSKTLFRPLARWLPWLDHDLFRTLHGRSGNLDHPRRDLRRWAGQRKTRNNAARDARNMGCLHTSGSSSLFGSHSQHYLPEAKVMKGR